MQTDIYPPGSVIAIGGTPQPDLWLLCDGALKTKQEYPLLFEAIAYTYGGEGASFALPDYRGRFLRGVAAAAGAGLAPAATPAVGVIQDWGTARPTTPFTGTAYFLPDTSVEINALPGGDCARNDGTLDLACCTGGGDDETRPLNVYVQFYIKAKRAVQTESA